MNQALNRAEFSPPLPSEDAGVRPELYLIQGDGEVVENAGTALSAELYAVPDPEEDAAAHSASPETEDETAGDADTVVKAAKKSESSDPVRHRSGGGWVIREYLKKQAAKETHERGCECYYCRS